MIEKDSLGNCVFFIIDKYLKKAEIKDCLKNFNKEKFARLIDESALGLKIFEEVFNQSYRSHSKIKYLKGN